MSGGGYQGSSAGRRPLYPMLCAVTRPEGGEHIPPEKFPNLAVLFGLAHSEVFSAMYRNDRSSAICMTIIRMAAFLTYKFETQMADQPDHLG